MAASIESVPSSSVQGAVLPAVAWALARDLKISLRSKAELGIQLLFYVIVVSLFQESGERKGLKLLVSFLIAAASIWAFLPMVQ